MKFKIFFINLQNEYNYKHLEKSFKSLNFGMKIKNFTLLIALLTATVWNNIQAQTAYDLYVGGIQVTSDNASDIGAGSSDITGSISYDYMTKTLILENATITTNEKNAIYNSNIDNLAIILIGTNTINTTDYNAIFLKKNTIISADGDNGSLSISAIGSDVSGIYIYENTTLTVEGKALLEVTGTWGINGLGGSANESLVVDESIVKATGGLYGSIADLASLTLIGCEITKPAGAIFNNSTHCVEQNGQRVTSELIIEPTTTKYELYIAGTQVTSNNATDIASANSNVTGNISYDDNTKTLTLDNATIKTPSIERGIHNSGIDGLKIVLKGSNTITAPDYSAVSLYANTTIGGTGSINISDTISSAIYISDNTTLTIDDGCSIEIYAMWGIRGKEGVTNEKVVINNATLKIYGRDTPITNLTDFTLNNCVIREPKGAVFNHTTHRLELDGQKITTEVIISPIGSGTTTVETEDISIWSDKGMLHINTENSNANSSNVRIYAISGKLIHSVILSDRQKASISLPTGIYVVQIGDNSKKIVIQ